MDGATVTAAELVTKASDQRERGRIGEALVSASRATVLDPSSADAFWQLALCQLDTGETDAAIESLKKVTELAPNFARGWTRLGMALEEADDEQAQECFERAIDLKPNEVDALLRLAQIYETNQQSEDEIKIRTALDELVQLGPRELNRIGILYHEKKDFYAALRYYRRVAKESTAGLFNLGLVFNTPEVSQQADAIDVWRRVLKIDPNNERAKSSINSLLPLQVRLRNEVVARSKTQLNPNQWYAYYISPIELLGFDNTIEIDDLNSKAIQRARKALLQEIELEDGSIDWMPELRIDRSRAMAVCEDLNDERLLRFHYHVFVNKDLSAFLSRGALAQFLVDDVSSPLATIELLEDDREGFGSWLSSRFAPQFSLVLTKALAERRLPVIECLLGGRRWVRPEDEDKCFDGAHRQIDQMLAPLRIEARTSEAIKPAVKSVEAILAAGGLGNILGLLPVAFYKSQQEAAMLIRSMAINCYNCHDDADSAKAILLLTSALALKSPSLQAKIADDIKALDERILEASKNEAHLEFDKKTYSITRQGVRFGDTLFSPENILTACWGVVITNTSTRQYEFSMSFKSSDGARSNIRWTATRNLEEQRRLFDGLVNAALTFVAPKLIVRIQQALKAGQIFRIGNVTITGGGILFEVAGWFRSKSVLSPWSRCKSVIANGDLILSDPEDVNARAALSLHDTDNAVVLYLIMQQNASTAKD